MLRDLRGFGNIDRRRDGLVVLDGQVGAEALADDPVRLRAGVAADERGVRAASGSPLFLDGEGLPGGASLVTRLHARALGLTGHKRVTVRWHRLPVALGAGRG